MPLKTGLIVPIGSSWGIQGWNLLNFLRNEQLYDRTAPACRTPTRTTGSRPYRDMRRETCNIKTFNKFQPKTPYAEGGFGIANRAA